MSVTGARPIVCVGEALVDLIATEAENWSGIEQFVPRIGGAPANTAVAIKRFGGDSAFLGCLANDDPGQWIYQRLADEGIDLTSSVQVSNAQTRLAIVTGPIDRREFVFYGNPPADSLLTPEAIEHASIGQASAVMAGSLLLLSEPGRSAMFLLLDVAVRHDVPITFDPNPRAGSWPEPAFAREMMMPFIQQASILKLGAEEPDLLGLTIEQIRAEQPEGAVLVVTDGPNGCRYWYGDERAQSVSTVPVRSVDSTGAGDAFSAALTLRYVANLRNITLDDLRFASVVGALTTTRHGAMNALPDRSEIDAAMREWRDEPES
jgi:fructokinase